MELKSCDGTEKPKERELSDFTVPPLAFFCGGGGGRGGIFLFPQGTRKKLLLCFHTFAL